MLDLGSVLLSETNRSYLKMDGWKMNFLLGPSVYFQGERLVLGRVMFSNKTKYLKKNYVTIYTGELLSCKQNSCYISYILGGDFKY